MLASTHVLAQSSASVYLPRYFVWVFGLLLVLGILGWLVATVLGFARSRSFGVSVRWFTMAAGCLILYHVHWLVLSLSIPSQNERIIFPILALLNLFVVLGAVCAIVGFAKLTKPAEQTGQHHQQQQ